MNSIHLKDVFSSINIANFNNNKNPSSNKSNKIPIDNIELFYLNIEKVF
jgi:hypothetical protein